VTDAQAANHALGLELQIEELVEQRERARVQRRPEDEARLTEQISALQAELADAAERALG
jgi:N-formylglutamate amidohydrolase